jgi:hypothetical protein
MQPINFSLYIVVYNFVIAVLLMIASEKIGAYAGYFAGSYKARISRLTRIGFFTFGTCVAFISLSVYIAFYVLKLHE